MPVILAVIYSIIGVVLFFVLFGLRVIDQFERGPLVGTAARIAEAFRDAAVALGHPATLSVGVASSTSSSRRTLMVAAEPEELRDRLQKEVQEAHQLAEQGKLDEAIRMLGQLVREVPSESLAVKLHYDLANLLFVQGRYREARAVYTRVIQLAEDQQEMTRRSRERIAKMKERESQKKDEVALQLIDIETAVDLGQFPPSGSKEFLRTVEKETASLHR